MISFLLVVVSSDLFTCSMTAKMERRKLISLNGVPDSCYVRASRLSINDQEKSLTAPSESYMIFIVFRSLLGWFR